jgi:hypothetical protein
MKVVENSPWRLGSPFARTHRPREHFARLVRMSLIDTQGRVTRLYGGEAEPEIDKPDELLRQNGNPG